MQKATAAYLRQDRQVKDMGAADFALLLWEKTDEEGILCVPERDYIRKRVRVGAQGLGDLYLLCRMEWSREEALALGREALELAEDLERYAALRGGEEAGDASPGSMESGPNWQRYVKPLEDSLLEADLERAADTAAYLGAHPEIWAHQRQMWALHTIPMGRRQGEDGPPMPGAEVALGYWCRTHYLKNVAERCLGKGLYGADVLLIGKYLYYLICAGATPPQKQEQLRNWLQFTALHRYARRAEPLTLYPDREQERDRD